MLNGVSEQAQASMVDVGLPCKVFGDIHGQFRDILLLLRQYGFPSHRSGDVDYIEYIFNGDWVDRGTKTQYSLPAHPPDCPALVY